MVRARDRAARLEQASGGCVRLRGLRHGRVRALLEDREDADPTAAGGTRRAIRVLTAYHTTEGLLTADVLVVHHQQFATEIPVCESGAFAGDQTQQLDVVL